MVTALCLITYAAASIFCLSRVKKLYESPGAEAFYLKDKRGWVDKVAARYTSATILVAPLIILVGGHQLNLAVGVCVICVAVTAVYVYLRRQLHHRRNAWIASQAWPPD